MSTSLVRLIAFFVGALSISLARAELTDLTQTPNAANEGIAKSLTEEVGTGRGDVTLPGSSLYTIARDPFRAIRRGRQLFQRKFTVAQGVGPRFEDGVGEDIGKTPALGAGFSDSCAACHGRPRGAAGAGGDVFTRPDSRDAPHLFGLGLQEMLADEMTAELRGEKVEAVSQAARLRRAVTMPLAAKGVAFGRLVANPDGSIDASAVQGVDADLRVKPFFAQGGTFSIRQFVVGALNDEMGLQSPDPVLTAAANGARVVTPSGLVLDGGVDKLNAPAATDAGADPDGDGVANEIDPALVDYLEFYLLNYFKPATYEKTALTEIGRRAMQQIGCTDCHRPSLTVQVDRRVADFATSYDSVRGIFNSLFATATPLFHETADDPALPALRQPNRAPFVVENFYSDLKRHDLGSKFWERNFDGTLRREFVTEPLWGVGTTAPYGHDGRSINLHEVILRHGGEAQRARDLYAAAPDAIQLALRAFLDSLVLFPPDDTASNLNPGDPSTPNFPQKGHGSMRLAPLFLDPSDPE
jgi:hypothetical protein